MNFKDLLKQYLENKTPVFVNGMPLSKGGLIVGIEDDFINFKMEFEVAQEKRTEVVAIPMNKIVSLSEGQHKGWYF